MKTRITSLITAGTVGLLTVTSLGMAQQVQAGTVSAESSLLFTDTVFELNGANITPLFLNTISGSAFVELDGNSDADAFAQGPVSCPNFLSSTANATVPNGSANSGATFDCLSDVINASNFAEIEMTGDEGQADSMGAYNFFTADFAVEAGDVFNLSGIVEGLVSATIEGWQPGDTKTAAANFLATVNLVVNDEVIPILEIFEEASIINQNGTGTIVVGPTPFDANYTFLENGSAGIEFFAIEQSNGTIMRTPEPSALISLSVLGIGALVSLKKRKNNAQ